ncbi:MAG: sel1 repeat family protein, partial [Parvibaculaceae bacterium]|nr:sel1 repeat family protein [Parvibaculaceae bacterium]
MKAPFVKARGRPSCHIVHPSEPFTSFEVFSGVKQHTRAFSTALVLTSLCLGALGTATAYSAEDARSLSDYRKAAEERTKNPSHKISPSNIGPDYGDAGNKPREFDIGVALYDANDFAGAYAIWLPLAQRDDLAAQRNVAHLLRHGKGTPQNLPRALYFYERASEGGLVPASVNAGVMHLRGEGTRADPETALRFLAVGVKSKHPVALYEVALMLAQGNGITKNPKKARDYLELSARSGYAPALQKLDALKAAELVAVQPKLLPTPPRVKP